MSLLTVICRNHTCRHPNRVLITKGDHGTVVTPTHCEKCTASLAIDLSTLASLLREGSLKRV